MLFKKKVLYLKKQKQFKMNLTRKEKQDLIDTLSECIIEDYQGTDWSEFNSEEYTIDGVMYVISGTCVTREFIPYDDGGEISDEVGGYKEMTIEDVEIDELSYLGKEDDELIIIF